MKGQKKARWGLLPFSLSGVNLGTEYMYMVARRGLVKSQLARGVESRRTGRVEVANNPAFRLCPLRSFTGEMPQLFSFLSPPPHNEVISHNARDPPRPTNLFPHFPLPLLNALGTLAARPSAPI